VSFDPARLSDPEYFADRRLPAHSGHRWFADADEAASGSSSFEQCLNGVWKFHYAKNLAARPTGFEAPDFDTTGWDDIVVPGHIQLQGYDRPQYVNTQYPWDGHENVEPPQVPQSYNPVASYVTTFEVDTPLAAGERLSVMFKGAESAISVWLNGTWIGYACDSFTPSEFDVTHALVTGVNKLAAQVFRFSAASWIEDQDFYRFSGLFRDVVLLRRPRTHVEDVHVTTTVTDSFDAATVVVTSTLTGEGGIRATLANVGDLTEVNGAWRIDVAEPRLWSAEHPHLYDLAIDVFDSVGAVSEHIALQVGIRRFVLEDGVFTINGERIVFNGVNRHEFGLQGRVMSREQTEADLVLLKQNNVNAIRTSHYPNNTFFYDLCDEYGFYVIDEMNLESHGMWDAIVRGVIPIEEGVPGGRPEWMPALIDRADSMVARDRNHACIIMWSCGNESFGGRDLLDLSNHLRAIDDRPVHYEGVHWDPRYPETTDVTSEMYTPAADVEAHLQVHRDKPFIMCEYAHAMGNSFGAVDKYVELAYLERLYQGGFIWDFADQAIALRDVHGRAFFGYGGDCGEAPHDAEFCGNGILFADHTPSPKLAAVKALYQGLKIAVDRESFTLTNRFLFTPSSAYSCWVTVSREGHAISRAEVETGVAPGATETIALPVAMPAAAGEYCVDVSFRLRTDERWASVGHEVAHGQGVFRVGSAVRISRPARPELVTGIHNIGVRGKHFLALFSRIQGGLSSYRFGFTPDGGHEMLLASPRPTFWHAPTSNETGWGMPFRDARWQIASRYAKVRDDVRVSEDDERVTVGFTYELPMETGTCDVDYGVAGDGHVAVTVTLRPGTGLDDPPEFGLQLLTQPQLTHLTWYGEGPEEAYVDRRAGAWLGVWDADVREQLTPYLRPQEAGSHTGVRWASVTDGRGRGLRFDAAVPMEFSALPWTPLQIEEARHPHELPLPTQTVIRPALMRRGVGGDQSWGAMTHEEYRLPAGEELRFEFGFQGLA